MTSKTIYLVYANDGDNKELVGRIASPEHFAIFNKRCDLQKAFLPVMPPREHDGTFSEDSLKRYHQRFDVWLKTHPDKYHANWAKWYTLEETQPWPEITL